MSINRKQLKEIIELVGMVQEIGSIITSDSITIEGSNRDHEGRWDSAANYRVCIGKELLAPFLIEYRNRLIERLAELGYVDKEGKSE